ncbi:exonuclease V subunit alpha [Nostoc sp. 'Peltigera membranacea cyanobiont' 213]|uniref:MobF family relaxase n=1 Tax=Nostoc sp. 'Peltigera membranacea cyanobiont' 213 TaxID=2014530 RepID=UPI000B95349F|nr:MobF family relaxase [Nostoc sp. 'Peltigera membranacea cyanobiont' 213]OYD90432.1 exonuclease V subunit alpha [Nostoc sp. 'Peltigera membranacea cyanobiont' 213]
MLTAANVSSEMAVNYFIKNYYHQGKSLWNGQGAKKLGLSGAVDDEDAFKNIIEGQKPDGREVLNARVVKEKGKGERRAALDCTFSAPKSVSLMALVGGDTRLIDAHHQALKETLELIEQRYAYTRVTDNSGRHRVKTGNLVVAQFDHIESRDLDPHLHTHCLLMNMTQTPDGRWLSLGNNEIFANKKFLGMAYQSSLAREVQKLGYEIELRLHGQFDIKGFKFEDLEAFSKRRQQIIASSGANSTWAEREKIWDDTRQRKQKLPESELVALWKEEAAALGITFVKPGEPRKEQAPLVVEQKSLIDALDDAIAHCSERNVAFKQEDLEKFILESRLATDVTAIAPLIREHQELIALPGLTHQFTTMTAVRRELATIDLMQQGQCKFCSISDSEVVENHLENTLLNSGQRQAVELAATTSDQFIAWQGVAGAGKTFALKELKAIAFSAGYIIKGFAPSSSAAKVLSEELKIQSETVARLLVSEPPPQIEPNQIWIVDEAGLLSAKDAHALLQRATLLKARVILVGDTRQLSAVSAGNPFKSLQQAGIKTAHLNESLRQKDPQLKLAVDLIADGRIEAGFARLEANGSILQVESESKIEQIANDYIVGTPEQRLKTLVLAGTNTERLALTQAIRSKLLGEGTLGETATITQLQTKNLTKVQMRFAHNFEIGDVIMPTRDYKRRGLSKGKLYEVVGRTTDKLTLRSDDGQHLEVDTAFDKAVYQRHQIEIAVGDRLQWKKNDRQLGRRNGQEFTVTGIDLNIVQIKYADERTESISLAQAQNLDYALVSTTYSSQGKTADRVLISADFTIGQESFYVAASRARHELKIYTEDPTRLVELAQQSKAKENALELLRKQVHNSTLRQRQLSPQLAITINISDELVAPVLKSDPVLKTPKSGEEPETKPICQKEMTTEIPVVKLKEIELPPTVTKPHIDKPVLKSAVPTEAFWTPHKSKDIPNFIEPKHWQEFESSAIHPDITAKNFESLQFNYAGGEHEAWERLMISEKLNRTNTGRLTEGLIRAYSHLDAGGWWCDAGVDARTFADLKPGEKPPIKRWGCYKPNQPRPKKDENNQIIEGKFIKYEHPPKVELSIFLLDVPDDIAERIYSKHKVNPSDSDRQSGFWYCVWKHNIPCAIAEGAKKAASLLSQGHAAIGLPGISAGYRTPKDEFGKKIGKSYLHEELAVFATPSREIKFCFDYETKPETKLHIERDISVTGRLLQEAGARVKVINLPGPDKGVDDFIAANGPQAYEKLSHLAPTFRDWQQQNQHSKTAAFPPLRKPIPEQRSIQLEGTGNRERATGNDKLDLLPTHREEEIEKTVACSPLPVPYLLQNKPQVQTHDFNQRQQPNSDTVPNREDRAIEQEFRAVTNQQPAIDPENRVLRNEPSREPNRNERESVELLAAINRDAELEKVFEHGDDIAGINQSSTDDGLRGQRTEKLSRQVNGQNSTIFNREASYVHSSQPATRQLLNTISDYVEQSAIESALTQTVLGLTEQLSQSHQQLVIAKSTFNEFETALTAELQSYAENKAILSIYDYVEQSAIESALTQAVLGLTEQLSQSHQQLVAAKSTFNEFETALTAELQSHAEKRAILSIFDYIEQSSIESTLAQTVLGLTEQLSRSHQQLVEYQTAFNDFEEVLTAELQSHAEKRAILSISDYIEQSAIESALNQSVLGLTEQLSQSHQQLLASKTTFNDFETALTQELKPHAEKGAILSISDYVEQSAIESALNQAVLGLTKQLSQSHQQLVASKTTFNDFETALTQELKSHAEKGAILSISDYVEQSAIESALNQAVLGLTKQLSQSHQQLVTAKSTFNDFETALTTELQSHVEKRAILSTSNSVEQSATESTLAKTLLAELKLHLKQMIQGLDIERLAEVVMEVGKYVKGEKVTGAKVSELFTSVTTDAKVLTFEEKMNIVRQLIRDDKPSIMKRLGINSPSPDENEEHLRFRR